MSYLSVISQQKPESFADDGQSHGFVLAQRSFPLEFRTPEHANAVRAGVQLVAGAFQLDPKSATLTTQRTEPRLQIDDERILAAASHAVAGRGLRR